MLSKWKLWSIVSLLSIEVAVPTEAAPATSPSTFWGGAYASCAITNCLVPITTSSGCEINDNSCVCTTRSFVAQVATCLGQKCPLDIVSVYVTYKGNCRGNGGYSLALNLGQFLTDGGALSSYLSTTFWEGYTSCVKSDCLVPLTAASGCEIDDNSCVCSNATLITQIAGCMGKSCTTANVASVYSQFSNNCASVGGYDTALSESEWLSAARAAAGSASSTVDVDVTSSTGTAIPTSTESTPTHVSASPSTTSFSTTSAMPSSTSTSTPPTPTASSGDGFTEDQKIAIGVGLGMGLPTIIISLITLWRKLRSRLNP